MMGKDFENPFGIKTMKGNLRSFSSLLDSGVFPGTQGGPLEHVIAAKAVAFGEALTDDFLQYTIQVTKNAHAMANEFVKRDYNLISGGTSNHCMLIDLRNKDITGKEAENALVKGDITVNKNMVPFDTQSPFVTSGIRIGTPAITTRGLVESDMIKVVDYIDQVIKNPGDESIHKEVKNEINNWMKAYSLYPKVSYPKSELV